jgi:hypothetical protein
LLCAPITKATFCGHDHVNNAILEYKGINLVYGNSIDYLAYWQIDKQGSQRGAVVLDIAEDGTQKYRTGFPGFSFQGSLWPECILCGKEF